jgi:hypothetical protein
MNVIQWVLYKDIAFTMADDINEQVAAHIREILRLVLDVTGRSLRNLNELVGQTSKFKL